MHLELETEALGKNNFDYFLSVENLTSQLLCVEVRVSVLFMGDLESIWNLESVSSGQNNNVLSSPHTSLNRLKSGFNYVFMLQMF